MGRFGNLWQSWIWTQTPLTSELVCFHGLPCRPEFMGWADLSSKNPKVSLCKPSTAIRLQRWGSDDAGVWESRPCWGRGQWDEKEGRWGDRQRRHGKATGSGAETTPVGSVLQTLQVIPSFPFTARGEGPSQEEGWFTKG